MQNIRPVVLRAQQARGAAMAPDRGKPPVNTRARGGAPRGAGPATAPARPAGAAAPLGPASKPLRARAAPCCT